MDICKTKYPILLVHGTGFRDRKRFGYWGRIPKTLQNHGAYIFYGHQDSWGTIEHNAYIVRSHLIQYLQETDCDKVNIVAHSKGGIEARYLISTLNCSSMVASLTTVSAPHHGSKTMDIINRMPKILLRLVSVFVNIWFKILGDSRPDFHTACYQFTTEYMRSFNTKNPDAPDVYYQSYATIMKNPFSDILMFFPNLVVNWIEGENDGLVTPHSASWANFKGTWKGCTSRGISHADSVDLRRRKFSKKTSDDGVSDICDCYVDIISNLKNMGL